ncbi:MAG: hypothetical protein K0Q74_85 [Gammaproteobacteria bacterium]|jgi:predicted transcriptional regulator YdeE|nr:hypothetical protein [Gammaproteobacteria bacterium]
MQKTIAQLPEIKLVGITSRTNNTALLFEDHPSDGKIAATMQQYFQQGLMNKMQHRKNPGTTFCVYTNYESDFKGDYTYFIGEEVDTFDEQDEALERLLIPLQNYAKFTNRPGPMPDVCINMWQAIWQMDASDLGGERAYISDFEIYDARSADYNNAILDIYVGINK